MPFKRQFKDKYTGSPPERICCPNSVRLVCFFFFYSGPQCCVVLLQRSAKLSRKTNKDNTFVTNAVRCCQKLMVHLMVRFASRIWLQSLSMGQISYPAWHKKGCEMYKFWCCRTISQCGKPRVNAWREVKALLNTMGLLSTSLDFQGRHRSLNMNLRWENVPFL